MYCTTFVPSRTSGKVQKSLINHSKVHFLLRTPTVGDHIRITLDQLLVKVNVTDLANKTPSFQGGRGNLTAVESELITGGIGKHFAQFDLFF